MTTKRANVEKYTNYYCFNKNLTIYWKNFVFSFISCKKKRINQNSIRQNLCVTCFAHIVSRIKYLLSKLNKEKKGQCPILTQCSYRRVHRWSSNNRCVCDVRMFVHKYMIKNKNYLRIFFLPGDSVLVSRSFFLHVEFVTLRNTSKISNCLIIVCHVCLYGFYVVYLVKKHKLLLKEY